ncbi:MAG: hypothetical protein N2114_01640, partial [Candidatus Goldbacteria bacterium]|nr:hypothetical protein [Candidatus Goldiibacteriota bacterium]
SYDTKNINLYIDGNKIFVINGFIYNSDETIKFADQWSGYKGYIDELCISRKIKAEEEIQNSYEHLNHYLFFKHL